MAVLSLSSIRPAAQERFRALADRGAPDDCWPWRGETTADGYGRIWLNARRRVMATWVALVMAGRPQPQGSLALHTCDNPDCVNPGHLYWGTHKQNMLDRASRKRTYVTPGEANHKAKLTEADIRAIRADPRSLKAIERDYPVRFTTIQSIKTRKTWRHVD